MNETTSTSSIISYRLIWLRPKSKHTEFFLSTFEKYTNIYNIILVSSNSECIFTAHLFELIEVNVLL